MSFRCLLVLILITSKIFTSSVITNEINTIRLIAEKYSGSGDCLEGYWSRIYEHQNISCFLQEQELCIIINDSAFHERFTKDNLSMLNSLKYLEKNSPALFKKEKAKKLAPAQIAFYQENKDHPLIAEAVDTIVKK